MKPLRLRVEYQETALVESLRQEVELLRGQLEALQRKHTALEVKYGYEMTVNNELIDLCRSKGIRYRSGVDMSKWS